MPDTISDRILGENCSGYQQSEFIYKKNRDFLRYFYRGATEVEMDATNRILIPRRLFEYAKIEKDVIVFAYVDRIEVWNRDIYEKLLTDAPGDFSDLAELTMGDHPSKPQEDVP